MRDTIQSQPDYIEEDLAKLNAMGFDSVEAYEEWWYYNVSGCYDMD